MPVPSGEPVPCPTCGRPAFRIARTEPVPVPPEPRLKCLRSVYETRDLPPHERIAEIMDFLDQAGRRKAERMVVGLEQHEARRVLDDAICAEKL
jgi:hypothetical protein